MFKDNTSPASRTRALHVVLKQGKRLRCAAQRRTISQATPSDSFAMVVICCNAKNGVKARSYILNLCAFTVFTHHFSKVEQHNPCHSRRRSPQIPAQHDRLPAPQLWTKTVSSLARNKWKYLIDSRTRSESSHPETTVTLASTATPNAKTLAWGNLWWSLLLTITNTSYMYIIYIDTFEIIL